MSHHIQCLFTNKKVLVARSLHLQRCNTNCPSWVHNAAKLKEVERETS